MPRARRVDPDTAPAEDEFDDALDSEDPPAPPARRRRAPAPAEKDEEPRATRRRRPAEEDVEDDTEDEEEAPAPRRVARSGGRREVPAKSKPVSRRRRDDDADEESDEDASVIPISRGRKEAERNRPVSPENAVYFKWGEDDQIVKFLDREPWAYNQHWVTREGKQSFPCLGKGCPLCDIGVKATQKLVYSVLNLTPEGSTTGEPVVQAMEVGVQTDEILAKYDASTKTGPLDRLYWAVSRTAGSRGGRKRYTYSFTPVKERDLEEDYSFDPDEVEDMVEAADFPSTEDVLGKWTRKSLQEIADEAMDHSR